MTVVKFTEEHEWILMEGNIGTVGISDYAQAQLGDVVFVEVPEVGVNFNRGDEVAVVESVKAASEVCAPVNGVIFEINKAIEENPSIVNLDAEGAGWFYKIKVIDLSELDELMDITGYQAFVSELD